MHLEDTCPPLAEAAQNCLKESLLKFPQGFSAAHLLGYAGFLHGRARVKVRAGEKDKVKLVNNCVNFSVQCVRASMKNMGGEK